MHVLTKPFITTLFAIIFFLPASAMANPYLGFSAVVSDYDDSSDFDSNNNMEGFNVTFGYDFNDYISTEIRWYEYVSPSTNKENGVTYEIEPRTAFGTYLKAGFPFGSTAQDVVKLYGLIGFSYIDYKVSERGENPPLGIPYEISSTEKESGISYGVGADFYVTETGSINIEYMAVLDKSDYDVNSFTVGYFFRF